jgi:RNA polymerase sigma-70 factor (ECF subfamily)
MPDSNLSTILSEKQIFLEFQEGKTVRFDYFFDKYYQGLCVYAFHMLKSKSNAEDLVQDFFVRLLENRKKLNISTSVKSYFLRSVHNRCLDFIAHQEVVTTFETYQLNTATDEYFQEYTLIDSELKLKIETAIQNLPDGIRETFIQNRFDGLSYKELAINEKISVKTVEYRISKALGILLKELGDYLQLLIFII